MLDELTTVPTLGMPFGAIHVPTSPHAVGVTLETPDSRSVPVPLDAICPLSLCGITQLVCSADSHTTPLLTMAPWQQLNRPPGNVPHPGPPHAPHVLGQQALPASETMPDVHIGGAGGGDGTGTAGGGGDGSGAAGGDGGSRRVYIAKPSCDSLAADGQPMHSIASSPLL